jgi:hypothetical protein
MIKINSPALAILLFSSFVLNSSYAATTWDATNDFTASTTSNPNGVWSYGYDPASTAGYQFKAFNKFSNANWTDSQYQSSGTPAFGKNLSGATVSGVQPGQITLHPGPVPNGDAAILRFTAPISSLYNVSAKFFSGDSSETDAWIVTNGNFTSPLISLGVTSANPSHTITSLQLAAGETLDFVVGNHGSYTFDNTPLTVQIALASQPAATCPSDTFNNGKLTINSVEVPNGFGGTMKYKATLLLQPLSNPLAFTLDKAEPLQ